MGTTDQPMKTQYLNPYIGGVLLGLVLLAANFIAGRGLGASGAIKSVVVATTQAVAPAYATNTKFFQEYHEEHAGSPMRSWLVFQMLGVIVGGFASGALAGRLKFGVPTSGDSNRLKPELPTRHASVPTQTKIATAISRCAICRPI